MDLMNQQKRMMAKNPKAHFVAALFDIDDFKFINDVYGTLMETGL